MPYKIEKILLINPHDTEQCGFTNPPLGLLYLAGTLLEHGFDVRIADGCKDGIAVVYQSVNEFKPDMVGITCLTPGRKKVIELADMVKQISPETIVVLGGVHPTIMYNQMMENYPSIDFIVLGEGERTLLELAQGKEPSTINGLVFKKFGKPVKTTPRENIQNLDEISFPAWHLVDLRRYQARGDFIFRGIDLSSEPRISVIFSRGCTGHCDFCSSWWVWQGYRHRSAKNMVDELEFLYREQGIQHFCFADDTMTADREATLELCDEIIARGLHIAFHATTRSDCVDEVLLSKMYTAGCYNIAYGIETGSTKLLKQMGKENDLATAEKAILMTKRAGIITTALIIVGNVGETEETLKETIELLKRMQPDIIACVGGLWILPGTKLYQNCKRQGIIDDDFWLGDEPYKIYTKEWPLEELKQMEQRLLVLADPELRELRQLIDDTNMVYQTSILALKCDQIFIKRLNDYPQAMKMDFWENHFEWQALIKYPEISGHILDFGCGSGHSDVFLARGGFSVHGIDMSPVGIIIANHLRSRECELVRKKLSFQVADVTVVHHNSMYFDSAWSSHVFEHITDPGPILIGLRNWLKPGAYMLISVPLGYAYDDPDHVNHFQNSDDIIHFFEPHVKVVKIDISQENQVIRVLCKFNQNIPGQLWLNGQVVSDTQESRQHLKDSQDLSFNPRIVCQMRIKNEEKWLKEVLDSIARVADGIVILDDGSTDRTPEICRSHRAVVDYRWQNEPVLDEVRDKNRLLQMVLAQNPDWVLCMDGDEIFEESASERIREAISTCPEDVAVLDVEFLYMWDDMQHYRIDGIYSRIYHHRLFNLSGQNREALLFQSTVHGGNFHCDSVPSNVQGRSLEIDVKIKHLGYMFREDRMRKYVWYKSNDTQHSAQGYYEHLLDQPGMVVVEWQERTFQPLHEEHSEADHLHAQSKQDLKPDYYYANARRNIADLVPQTAKRVLDVGCGQGLTGGLLRAERGIEVIGLELHPEVAKVAKLHLDSVIVGDFESMDLPFAPEYFDCIILADVLEHLVDPWNALQKITKYLSAEGTIIASIPNIRNLGIIGKLMDGSWEYMEQGILDRGHLRFFARKDMLNLFASAGLHAEIAEVVRDPLFENVDLQQFHTAQDINYGRLVLKGITNDDLIELTAQQFIFVAKPISKDSVVNNLIPLVSVVIPIFNNFAYTKNCLESIFSCQEHASFEVIIVDDASTDSSSEQIRQLPFPVQIVRHEQNKGFAISCNDGAKAALGMYVLFLNNDTVVLPGWIDALVACLQSDTTIGLAGNLQIFPDSGKVQQAGIVCGENKMLYSIYNNQLLADHPAVNKPREFQFIAGSCMIVEKELFFSVNGFDESYLNSCEDVDLCMKIRRAGKKVYYCPQSRIYHFESKTVSGHSKKSYNYLLFLKQWHNAIQQDDFVYYSSDGFATNGKDCV